MAKYCLWEVRHRISSNKNKQATFLEQFIAGGIGGFFCWFFSYPQDVIKTKLQT